MTPAGAGDSPFLSEETAAAAASSRDLPPQGEQVEASGRGDARGAGAEESTLAAEVLQVSGLLAQEGAAKDGGLYTFAVDGLGPSDGGSGRFELARDDTLHLIGLLNSAEVDLAKRELGVLLNRLDRRAVEGLTHQLLATLRHRRNEMTVLEGQGSKSPPPQPVISSQGPRSRRRQQREDASALWDRRNPQVQDSFEAASAAAGQPGRLLVQIVGARGLRDADWFGKSDPYCVCSIPGRESAKAQTSVMSRTTEPFWNEELEIADFRPGDTLQFQIFDKDMWPKADDFLGKAELSSSAFAPGGFDGELELEDTRTLAGVRPVLRVRVAPQALSPSMDYRQQRVEEDLRRRPRASAASGSPRTATRVEAAPRPPRTSGASAGTRDDEMPQVFRRLTAPAGGHAAADEIARARAALLSSSANQQGMPITIGGGIASAETGPQASAYLEALLEAHEIDTGAPATASRRQQATEEIEENHRRSLRVPEEKAKEIFDRLYRSGKEHRVRRRVYHELGLLVEQAKEAQTCTFEPRCPLAGYPGGMPIEGNVSERLYREGLDRIRRREELAKSAPAPPFRPQIGAPPPGSLLASMRRVQRHDFDHDQLRDGALISPRNSLPAGGDVSAVTVDNLLQGDDGGGLPVETNGLMADLDGELDLRRDIHYEPPHLRLFREHAERLHRKREREDADAEWRKYNYKPDISSSQASGPQVTRAHSLMGYPSFRQDGTDMLAEDAIEQGGQEVEAAASLAALAAHSLTTPRSDGIVAVPVGAEQLEEASGLGNVSAMPPESGEALLLSFPEALWPASHTEFEEEIVQGLAVLGASHLAEVTVHLVADAAAGLPGVTAELRGSHTAVAELAGLSLLDLVVSGCRVGEARLTSSRPLWSAEESILQTTGEDGLAVETEGLDQALGLTEGGGSPSSAQPSPGGASLSTSPTPLAAAAPMTPTSQLPASGAERAGHVSSSPRATEVQVVSAPIAVGSATGSYDMATSATSTAAYAPYVKPPTRASTSNVGALALQAPSAAAAAAAAAAASPASAPGGTVLHATPPLSTSRSLPPGAMVPPPSPGNVLSGRGSLPAGIMTSSRLALGPPLSITAPPPMVGPPAVVRGASTPGMPGPARPGTSSTPILPATPSLLTPALSSRSLPSGASSGAGSPSMPSAPRLWSQPTMPLAARPQVAVDGLQARSLAAGYGAQQVRMVGTSTLAY